MKNIKPFGPSIGKCKVSKNFITKLNNEFDKKTVSKLKDYSSKLASQIQNEVKLERSFIRKFFTYITHSSTLIISPSAGLTR